MKAYTHAWLACMAIKRLKDASLTQANRSAADDLIDFFMDHKDDVVQGAWYPDAVICDMGSSHVMKTTPGAAGQPTFLPLRSSHRMPALAAASPVANQLFTVDPNNNLPERCEAIAHSIVDNLKMRDVEREGSPICPTSNHISLRLFMLSHYVADAHMPLHCDSRRFSTRSRIHAHIEEEWDDLMKDCYQVDTANERFVYDQAGFPARRGGNPDPYTGSYIEQAETELSSRRFQTGYGGSASNVLDFMTAVCQCSYLVSYAFFPPQYDETNVNRNNWDAPLGALSFVNMSAAVLADAIDSIALIWLRVWKRYLEWRGGRQEAADKLATDSLVAAAAAWNWVPAAGRIEAIVGELKSKGLIPPLD
jgi:hypothetical protein